MYSLSRRRERAGVRVDMTSDDSPSLSPRDIPSSDFYKEVRDSILSPRGEERNLFSRQAEGKGILASDRGRFVAEQKRIPVQGGFIL
jgi:hypothetical protein